MGFANDIIGGAAALIRAAIKSPNFVAGSAGWTVRKDGTAEFNSVTIRNGQIISGTDLVYSGPPAFGTLAASISATSATDSFGNQVLAGIVQYGATVAVAWHSTTQFDVYTGSPGGPWTLASKGLSLGSSTAVTVTGGLATDTLTASGAITATGGTAGSPTLIETDSWQVVTPPTNFSGTLQYRLLPTGNVQVQAQLTVAAAAAAGTVTLFTVAAPYRASLLARGPVGYIVNGAGSTAAQLAAIAGTRWSSTAGGTFALVGFTGGAASSGVTEIDFTITYPTT